MKRIKQSNNQTIKQFFLSALVAFCAAVPAFASWTYDSSEKTLTDGNWTFTAVSVGTAYGKSGLIITSSATVSHTDASQTVVDFTNCADDPDCGQPLVAVQKNFGNNLGATKFIAPDCVQLACTFQRNKVIEEVEISADIEAFGSERCFENCSVLRKVTPTEFPKATSVHKNMFVGDSLLEGSFSFPNATSMGDTPFTGCAKITGISIPKCKTLHSSAFSGCSSLVTATLSPDVTVIPASLFENCSSLAEINGLDGDALTEIGSSAFGGCAKLANLPSSYASLTTVGYYAFGGSGISGDVSMPLAASQFQNTFHGAANLTSLYAPSVTCYGHETFFNCTALTNVVVAGGTDCFPSAMARDKKAPNNSFYGCSALQSVTWVGGLCPTTTTKPTYAFSPNASGSPTILWLKDLSGAERTAWGAYCDVRKDGLSDAQKGWPHYDEVKDHLIGLITRNNDCCWVVEVPSSVIRYDMTIACPTGVSVGTVLADDEEVRRNSDGTYTAKSTASLDITYVTTGLYFFSDQTRSYTVEGVTPAETIPASTCDKAVVMATPRTLSLDTATFAEDHIKSVTMAVDNLISCVTNDGVIVWTVIDSAPFSLVYAPVLGYRFEGDAKTATVAYESGIAADTVVSRDTVPKTHEFVSTWSWDVAEGTCTDGNWTFACTKYASKKWNVLSTVGSVTGICLTAYVEGEGVLNLKNFKADTAAQASAAGVENYDVIEFNSSLFSGNKTVQKVVAPSILKLGASGFRACTTIQSVEVSPDIAYIGDRQFLSATAFAEFIPTRMEKLEYIGSKNDSPGTFHTGSSLLTGDFVLGKVELVNNEAFTGTGITSIELPEATMIDNTAFNGCKSLTNAVMPKVKDIGSSAFSGCGALTNVTINSQIVTNIGTSAFNDCRVVANFPTDWPLLERIGYYTFAYSSFGGDVKMPSLVDCERAFEGAYGLTSFHAPKMVLFGDRTFLGCAALTNVVVNGSECFPTTMPYEKNRTPGSSFSGCTALADVWYLGESAPTNHPANSFSPGTLVNGRPTVLHVNVTDSNRADWEAICTVKAADFTKEKLAPGYRAIRRAAIGLIGTVKTNSVGEYASMSSDKSDLCWVVEANYKTPGFTVIVR